MFGASDDIYELTKERDVYRAALFAILKRHDDGKCTCGGCCIARGALTGKRGDDVAALEWPKQA